VRGEAEAAMAVRTSWSVRTLQEQTIMDGEGQTLLCSNQLMMPNTAARDREQKKKHFFEIF